MGGGKKAPKFSKPAFLSTGPESGYTHWGQQVFHVSNIPLLEGETTVVQGSVEMTRTKDNARLYNCRIRYNSTRRNKSKEDEGGGDILMRGNIIENVYQI